MHLASSNLNVQLFAGLHVKPPKGLCIRSWSLTFHPHSYTPPIHGRNFVFFPCDSYTHTYIWLSCMENVGKYISPMDPTVDGWNPGSTHQLRLLSSSSHLENRVLDIPGSDRQISEASTVWVTECFTPFFLQLTLATPKSPSLAANWCLVGNFTRGPTVHPPVKHEVQDRPDRQLFWESRIDFWVWGKL